MNAQEILEWVRVHPTRDGDSWAGWDGSFLYRLGVAPMATSIESLRQLVPYGMMMANYETAPVGAVHFFESGSIGHAGVDVWGGGALVITSEPGELWADGLIGGPVEEIAKHTPYIGWYKFEESNHEAQ